MKLEKLIVQTKLWAVAGRILPVVALGVIFFVDMVGYVEVESKIKVIIASLFFASVVYWWWWSTFRIYQLSQFLSRTDEKLSNVTQSLRDIRRSLRDENDNFN